jgi:hypothetical protein
MLPQLCLTAVLMFSASAQDSRAASPEASVESKILRVLLREIVVPWRDKGRENPPPLIAVATDSISLCPPPPGVRGCLSEMDLKLARADEGIAAWSPGILRDLESLAKEPYEFKQLDISGFDRVVLMPRAQLSQTKPYPMPFAMTRPAVRGKTAMVYVQFAQGHTVFVLLTETDKGWTVTTQIAYGAG